MVAASAASAAQEKREQILDAALGLFSERGFHGTAVPLVAERAKVGAGTLYRYFESKEVLVNALFQREKSALGRALQQGFSTGGAAREQFRRLWNALWAFARERPESIRFLDLHHHAAYLDSASQQVEARVMQPVIEFVAKAQKDQALKPMDPIALIALVYGAFVGLAKAGWQGHLQLGEATLSAAENCIWEAVRL